MPVKIARDMAKAIKRTETATVIYCLSEINVDTCFKRSPQSEALFELNFYLFDCHGAGNVAWENN